MSSFSKKKSRELFNAARSGNLELVKSLSVDREVNLNGGFDCTPFWIACWKGHMDVVRYLLDFHDNHTREPIEYDLANNLTGWTPFFVACAHGHEKVVEMLLEGNRIDVNKANHGEKTPLWNASNLGQVKIVKRLLASTREIDVLKKDTMNKKTATEIARSRGYKDVVALIEAYQEDPEGIRKQLRRELGIDAHLAGELFALVVYLSDGYLSIRPEYQGQKEQRFLSIAARLPMELQMILCNQAYGLPDSILKNTDSERGFRKYAKGF